MKRGKEMGSDREEERGMGKEKEKATQGMNQERN